MIKAAQDFPRDQTITRDTAQEGKVPKYDLGEHAALNAACVGGCHRDRGPMDSLPYEKNVDAQELALGSAWSRRFAVVRNLEI